MADTYGEHEYVARGVEDVCVAVGIAVLDLFADGADFVIVTNPQEKRYRCDGA